MITETDKKIIEIIEPYMEKDLSQGCLVIHEKVNNWEPQLIWQDLSYYANWYITNCKVIWHYDITAVFDYINSINLHWVWAIYFDNIIWQKDYWVLQTISDWEYIKIPRKPLHLYTEQEEANLLELLLKLKN